MMSVIPLAKYRVLITSLPFQRDGFILSPSDPMEPFGHGGVIFQENWEKTLPPPIKEIILLK
jgi:hypothetical protein